LTSTNTPSLTPVIEATATETAGTAVSGTGGGTPAVTASLTPVPSSDAVAQLTQSALKTHLAQTNIAATCTAAPLQNVGCGGPATGAVTATSITPIGPTLSAAQLTGTARKGTAIAQVPVATKPLPQTGIFEDLAGGRASPDSLAYVGLGALALVGVIVV